MSSSEEKLRKTLVWFAADGRARSSNIKLPHHLHSQCPCGVWMCDACSLATGAKLGLTWLYDSCDTTA